MARSRSGRRMSPPDHLFKLTPDAPEAATRPAAPAKEPKAPHPEAPPDIAAALQRIATQLDTLVGQVEAPSGGEKRPAGAEADALAVLGELRGAVDAAAQETSEAREALSERLAAIEAAVGEPAEPPAAGEVVEHLKLARSVLVGLSERMEGLERRLPETLDAIERAAAAVRETAATLAATAKTLDEAAHSNAEVLPKVEVLRKVAFGWSLVIGIVVIGFIVMDMAVRFELLQRLTALP